MTRTKWDSAAGIRERLYLLTRVNNPLDWIYSPVTDHWTEPCTGRRIKVDAERSESLRILSERGLSETQALELANGTAQE